MRISRSLLGASLCVSCLLATPAVVFSEDAVPAQPVVAQPKFERYDPATYKGELGKVALPAAGQSMFLLRRFEDGKPGDYLQVSGTEKNVSIPTGTYKLQYCTLTVESKPGTSWSTVVQGDIEKDKVVKIESGKTTRVESIDKAAASMREVKTGTVSLPYAGESAVFLLRQGDSVNGGYLQGTGKSKDLAVPEGKYVVANYSSIVADKSGTKWRITMTPASGKAAEVIEVKQGSTVKLSPCDPISASINVKQDADKMTLSLQMAGKVGCSIMRADGKGDPPGFQMLDKSGKIVASGKFAYG